MAAASGAVGAIRVGSNPTLIIIFFALFPEAINVSVRFWLWLGILQCKFEIGALLPFFFWGASDINGPLHCEHLNNIDSHFSIRKLL